MGQDQIYSTWENSDTFQNFLRSRKATIWNKCVALLASKSLMFLLFRHNYLDVICW